ncbi:type VI secretion protein [Sphingomonas sp. BN140010]|uniref:Type VI secretion protein n=1 Tax=Sphingomonas arvum TaxID=2992113 RepID=A0ABT3JCT1_9SPHN|nr:TrbI/VirB10 family protein [Sphingomonas sp. BN140010]MCW3796884.1 type VI secretion protein [Sphingomonas sp. BN140010]
MNAADNGSTLRRNVTDAPIGLSGQLVPFDPRRDMDEGALVEASRVAYPAVAAKPSRKEGFGLAAGGAAAVLLGVATFLGLSSGRDTRPATAAPPQAPAAAPATPVAVPPPSPEQLAAMNGATHPTGSLVFSSPPTSYPQISAVTPPGAASNGIAERLRSPALVFDESGPVLPAATDAPAASSPTTQARTRPGPVGDDFAARADASASDTATARPMVDPASTVSQGTLIPAVLETAINSDLPGYVRAVVSQDVRSFDGSRVLIPRSSRLVGQYKSGLAAGQSRAYVLWSRLIRPDGVSVAIASPGTDEAGQSGLAGEVDSHFFKRFGSALLLSVVGAASAIGTGGGSMLGSGGGASAAGVAAQQNGSIPPTVRVRQGQPIRVFTARDLDFSRVGSAGQP